MKIVTTIRKMTLLSAKLRAEGARLGLVPTMGALHDGHISLLKKARRISDVSVMSIFVNPAQFGPAEDLHQYPRPFEADCALAEKNGCQILFAPGAEAMYPKPYMTYVTVEGVTERLCGASRPGHFRGVATVVLKFFNIVSPHTAVFGQKDAQQVIVLRRMAEDLNCPVRLVVAPTVRERDGLAMSSRNRYLTGRERSQAAVLYQGLSEASRQFDAGERSASRLRKAVESVYRPATLLTVEYIEIADVETLGPLAEIGGRALVAVAARTGETGTRLIDNVVLGGNL
jgi:pantoate--beta-alanine ligase